MRPLPRPPPSPRINQREGKGEAPRLGLPVSVLQNPVGFGARPHSPPDLGLGSTPHPRVLIPAQPLMSRVTLGRAPKLPVPQFPPGDNHSTHVRVSTSTAQSMCTASAQ